MLAVRSIIVVPAAGACSVRSAVPLILIFGELSNTAFDDGAALAAAEIELRPQLLDRFLEPGQFGFDARQIEPPQFTTRLELRANRLAQ